MQNLERRSIGLLGCVIVTSCVVGCRTVTEYPPPPEKLWLFVADDTSNFSGDSATSPTERESSGGMPMLGYDLEGRIAIFATRSYGRAPFIAYRGHDRDDMVGYGRGREATRGTNRGGRKGNWVEFTRLGGWRESPRVASAMARLGLDEMREE